MSMTMTLQIMSDLHLEMHADRGAAFLGALDPTGVDVLVLAGDITSAGDYATLTDAFAPLTRKYRHVLYVPGNHEYYKTSPAQASRNLARLAEELPGVVVPDNRVAVIDGQRFLAGTMWFRPDPAVTKLRGFMSDFTVIRGFEPWVYEQNAAFERVLAAELRPGDVVITHHLPAPGSVWPRFVGSPLNVFFVCDMTPHIEARRPKLWIHGHTHTRCDYHLGDTRIVANPLGYPKELESQRAFDGRFCVEV
jgi:predicted phosphodiesterase